MRTVAIAGHFNPLHVGHLNLIGDAATLGDYLIVIVCNDDQARLKRDKVFLPMEERMRLVEAIRGVGEVVASIDTGTDVSDTLRSIRPTVFANGCDENHPDLIKEMEVCKELGIEVALNVGGSKIRSSSEILEKYHA